MSEKKLAVLTMDYGRTITGLVHLPASDNYYLVEIVKIENPIRDDWQTNDMVKIGKTLIQNLEWK